MRSTKPETRMAYKDAIHADTTSSDGSLYWLEATLRSSVHTFESILRTFLQLLARPASAPQLATSPQARPFVFLVSAMLAGGALIDTSFRFLGRNLEDGIIRSVVGTVSGWGIRELFMMTLPPLIVVWVTVVALSWLSLPSQQRKDARLKLMHGCCHAIGVQCLLIAMATTVFLIYKTLHSALPEDYRWTRDSVLFPILMAIALPGILQIDSLVKTWGTRLWTRQFWSRLPAVSCLSLVCSAAVACLAYETFDLQAAQKFGSQQAMEDWDARTRVLAKVLVSELDDRPASDGEIIARQTIALTNVASLPQAIPLPRTLMVVRDNASLIAREFEDTHAVEIADCAEVGLVIAPGETRLISWDIKIPGKLATDLRERDRLNICLQVSEIDVDRWQETIELPFGPSSLCHVSILLDGLLNQSRLAGSAAALK